MVDTSKRRHMRWLTWSMSAAALATLSACASWSGREPVKVHVVGLEPLPGESMEARMALKLRIINPNDTPIEFDGIALDLALRGQSFASGVSNERGSVPRFGEAVVAVPISISAWALVRQVMGLGSGSDTRVDYALSGRLAGTGLGSVRFASSGELDLPRMLGAR